jgi:hypothetical protein
VYEPARDGSLASCRRAARTRRSSSATPQRRSFDWQDFYFNWEGELFFEWLRGELVPERYDLVLVDSRTGVTEMGGICAYQLGDAIVMMCAANHQNVRGTQNVAADFLSPQVLALRQNRPPQIVVVPARIEQRRQELLDEFMARFEATFGDRVPAALRARGIGFADLLVPYEPQYAFDERILADPANVAQRERIATAFHRLADAMTYLAAPGTRPAAPRGTRAGSRSRSRPSTTSRRDSPVTTPTS